MLPRVGPAAHAGHVVSLVALGARTTLPRRVMAATLDHLRALMDVMDVSRPKLESEVPELFPPGPDVAMAPLPSPADRGVPAPVPLAVGHVAAALAVLCVEDEGNLATATALGAMHIACTLLSRLLLLGARHTEAAVALVRALSRHAIAHAELARFPDIEDRLARDQAAEFEQVAERKYAERVAKLSQRHDIQSGSPGRSGGVTTPRRSPSVFGAASGPSRVSPHSPGASMSTFLLSPMSVNSPAARGSNSSVCPSPLPALSPHPQRHSRQFPLSTAPSRASPSGSSRPERARGCKDGM
jgi:hypothetical protein